MNDFRYVQIYSILNSLFTLVTSHLVTNYLINLFNNIKVFFKFLFIVTSFKAYINLSYIF